MQLANKFISELYLVASNTFSELSAQYKSHSYKSCLSTYGTKYWRVGWVNFLEDSL